MLIETVDNDSSEEQSDDDTSNGNEDDVQAADGIPTVFEDDMKINFDIIRTKLIKSGRKQFTVSSISLFIFYKLCLTVWSQHSCGLTYLTKKKQYFVGWYFFENDAILYECVITKSALTALAAAILKRFFFLLLYLNYICFYTILFDTGLYDHRDENARVGRGQSNHRTTLQ